MLVGSPGKALSTPKQYAILLMLSVSETGKAYGCWPAVLQTCFVWCRRLIYYPRSDWDHEQFAIYLTPVASQHSRVGWLRQVSFNVRVHGHDSPSQSIWASEFTQPYYLLYH